jgi:hypothetical protein
VKRKTVKRADGKITRFCGERVEQKAAAAEAGRLKFLSSFPEFQINTSESNPF